MVNTFVKHLFGYLYIEMKMEMHVTQQQLLDTWKAVMIDLIIFA